MAKKAKQTQPDSLEGIEQALTRSEQFIEENSEVLSYIVGVIVILIVLYIGAKRFYFTPLEEEAAGQMFMAEKFFERDSFDQDLLKLLRIIKLPKRLILLNTTPE